MDHKENIIHFRDFEIKTMKVEIEKLNNENQLKDQIIYDTAVKIGQLYIENENLKREIERTRNNAIEMEQEMNSEIEFWKSLAKTFYCLQT